MNFNWFLWYFSMRRGPVGPTRLGTFHGHNKSKQWIDEYSRKDGDNGSYTWDDDQEIKD
jgi:hypothetical protein